MSKDQLCTLTLAMYYHVFWLPYYDDSNTTLNEEPRMNNAKLTSEEAK